MTDPRHDALDLADRVALVTGGASGLGRAVCTLLANHGCLVAVGYASSGEAARSLVATVDGSAKRARAYALDVGRWDQVASVVAAVEKDLGPIDILVNSAGITAYAEDPMTVLQDDWERVLAVNLGGTMGTIQAVLPGMRTRGAGTIVNISSIAGIMGIGSSLAYIASKAAVIKLTVALARGLAPAIRVNAVAPGSMPTRWYDRYYPEAARPPESSMTPVDRVADAVLWLIQNDAVTGEVIIVDRGESLTYLRDA